MDEPVGIYSYKWNEYISYFWASFYLDINNYEKFEKLVLNDQNLPFCLRRLSRQGDMDQKTKTKYVKYLNQIISKNYPNKEYDEILAFKCADIQLYKELNIAESKELKKYEKDIKNIEMLYFRKKL